MALNSSSPLDTFYQCLDSTIGYSIMTTFTVAKFLFLPLSLFVLYLGHQRWRQQRSFATTSHSDIFTYHLAVVDLIFVLGAILCFSWMFCGLPELNKVGYYLCSVFFPGETSFHILTCVERYLAVVHPVIYLELRQSLGVRIRNISIGCVWLLCFGWTGVSALFYPDLPYIPYVCVLAFSIVVVSFCSLSVLCVLIRPGPGQMGGERVRVDQSKQRAFHTITAITGVLWLYFLGYFFCIALYKSHMLSVSGECVMLLIANVVTLPSRLVLPLLFLHRAGKLLCCQSSDK